MKNSFFWIIIVVLVFIAFIGSAIWYKNQGAGGGQIPDLSIGENDQKRGNGSVEIIEYSDFQCPGCRAYYPIVEEMLAKRGPQVTFVYRHFPLPQHFNAYPSAQAAEAAGRQGKFFEMGYLLFLDQDKWKEMSAKEAADLFREYASSLSLDLTRFDADFNDSSLKNKIRNDYKSGVKLQVNQTPTFFVDGKKLSFEGVQSNEDALRVFDNAIDNALREKNLNTEVSSGTAPTLIQ